MKHRKLLLIVSLALALTMSLGGTLAYLTDRDSETNTFTLGQVDIEIKEEKFNQNDPLWPGEQSDKDAYIVNAGQTDAWVWMTVIVPANIKDYVKPVWAEGVKPDFTAENENGDKVYTVLVDEKLTAGQTTGKILEAIEMSNLVDVQNGKMVVVKNGQPVEIENANLAKLDVTVNAYAVQAEGIETVQKAYEAYNAQWGLEGGGSSGETEEPEGTPVADLAALREAVKTSGTVVLTADIQFEDVTISIPAGVEVILELNGKSLSTEENAEIFENNGTLTIKGDGILRVPGNQYVITNKSVLTIDGATVKGANTRSYPIRNNNNAQLTIKGESVVEGNISNGKTNATVMIEGGTFTFDPSQYVAEGYQATQNTDGTYTVTAK